ncbi:MAG: GHKL domain-containing protein [Lachnospiraceae bacterium]|nr:GHKL domain-containing protein [Lachnospiraceae bacterium]
MEYLIEHFQSFSNIYMTVIIELYLVMVAVLFAVWIKPFLVKQRSWWIAILIYHILQIIRTYLGTGKSIDSLITLFVIGVLFFSLWLLDDKRNPIQKLFLCVIFRVVSWLTLEIVTEIGMFEAQLILGFDWYAKSINATVIEFILWNFIQYGIGVLLLYAVIRILHKTYRYKKEEMPWQELVMLLTPAWSLLLVKPIMSSYFTLWMDGIENGSIKENIPGNAFRLLFSVFSLLSIIAIIVMYQRLTESRERIFAARSLERQIEEMRNHVSHIESMHDKIRGLKHDMGNHLAVIMRLAETGEKEKMSEYIESLQGKYEEIDLKTKSGNPVTDVILSEYASRFQAASITFTTDFRYPEGLNLDAFDISIVLMNALQNALEASTVCTEPEVHLKSVLHTNVFIINIRNCVDKKYEIAEEGMPVSEKTGAEHGYGLRNIRDVARKYRGDIEIRQDSTDDGYEFVLNVMMIGE